MDIFTRGRYFFTESVQLFPPSALKRVSEDLGQALPRRPGVLALSGAPYWIYYLSCLLPLAGLLTVSEAAVSNDLERALSRLSTAAA